MPCDEKRTVSVIMEGLDEELMKETLAELGIYAKYENGKLTNKYGLKEETITRIKQMYAKKAVKKIARKRGWTVANEKEDTLELTR
jgi:uncharacterized protein YecA (UPF0149 family)